MIEHDRSLYLGSSEIAAIIGLSPWKTAYEVWESKRPGFVPAYEPEDKAKRLSRGKRFEPVILDQYQEESGVWITALNTRYIDGEYPFITCEVDAEQTEESSGEISNVEIKSVAAFDSHNWGPSGTDEIPAYYAAQVMFTMMVTGRKQAIVAALIGLDDLRTYVINRDEDLIAYIRDKAVGFWMNHVVADIPPAIQSKDDALKMVSRFSGVTVEADEDTRMALDRLQSAKAEKKVLEEECDKLELKIHTAFANGTEGEPGKALLVDSAGNQLASWNIQNRDGFTVQPTSFRVLRIKKQKGAIAA